jgi:hypothetical protein
LGGLAYVPGYRRRRGHGERRGIRSPVLGSRRCIGLPPCSDGSDARATVYEGMHIGVRELG